VGVICLPHVGHRGPLKDSGYFQERIVSGVLNLLTCLGVILPDTYGRHDLPSTLQVKHIFFGLSSSFSSVAGAP
jgi:hypothetical protein